MNEEYLQIKDRKITNLLFLVDCLFKIKVKQLKLTDCFNKIEIIMSIWCQNQILNQENTECKGELNEIKERMNTCGSRQGNSRGKKGLSLSKQFSKNDNGQSQLSAMLKANKQNSSNKPTSRNNIISPRKNINMHKGVLQTNKESSNQKNTRKNIMNKLAKNNAQQVQMQIKVSNSTNKENRESQADVPSSKFYHKHQNIQKLMTIYKEKTENQLKECTFNPKINPNSAMKCPRTVDKFYQDQLNYHSNTEDKIQQMRQMIEKNKNKPNTFKPVISQQTRQITTRRSQTKVYDRLYSESMNKQKNKNQLQGSQSTRRLKDNSHLLRHYSDKNISNIKNNNDKNGSSNKKTYKDVFAATQKNQSKDRKARNMQNNKIKSQIMDKLLYKNLNWQPESDEHMEREEQQNVFLSNEQHIRNIDCQKLVKSKEKNWRNSSQKYQQYSKGTTRRQSKQQKPKNILKSQNTLNCRTLSTKNEQIVLQKFIKEVIHVISSAEINQKLKFSEMLEFTTFLNFVQGFQDISDFQRTQQKQLLLQIWDMLQGSIDGQILTINLIKVFCCLMGHLQTKLTQSTLSKLFSLYAGSCQYIQNVLSSFQGSIDQQNQIIGILYLSNQDARKIKKNFQVLHLNRFRLGQSSLLKAPNSQQFSFKPSISKQSQKLAVKYRQRIIKQSQNLIQNNQIEFKVPQDGMIDHVDLLMLDQKRKNYILERQRQEKQQRQRKLQQQSMAQCSNTNRSHLSSLSRQISSRSISQMNKRHTSSQCMNNQNSSTFSRISCQQGDESHQSKDNVFQQLYEQGKKSRSSRRDKQADEIEYQKNKDQLTFTPKIGQIKSKTGQNSLNSIAGNSKQIANFNKQVHRMQKSNFSKINNNNSESVSKNRQDHPLLYLNVSMQGYGSVKVPVLYEDDFDTLAEKVRVLMNIQDGQQEKRKLKTLLQTQIIPALKSFSKSSNTYFKLLDNR